MAERVKPAVLCWDLDGTVGNFTGMRSRSPESSQPISLRYGIRDLLSDFSEANGYTNVITSSAGTGYITEALNRSYLRSSFSAVFGNDTIQQTPQGKHYRSAIHSYSEKEMQAHVIAIGDNRQDKPIDVSGMVFIELGTPEVPLDALVIREIITTILEEGNGSFKDGYESWYTKTEPLNTLSSQRRKHIDIGNDITFTMEYRIADELEGKEERKVPVIYDIRSDTHTKPFEVFF